MSYTIPTLTSSISSKPIGNVSGIILSLTQIICSFLAFIIIVVTICNYIRRKNRLKKENLSNEEKIKLGNRSTNRFSLGLVASVILALISCIIGTLHNYAKPIIYLYPKKKEKVKVKLKYPEKLTCTYPKYQDSWEVIADTDGKLTDVQTNKEFYALYWEGKGNLFCNLKEGFCVPGDKTAEFLEEKLKFLSLNYKESNEFIMYWLPQLEKNKYNFIRFESIEFLNSDEYMPLEITPAPDTLIRILMQYKPLSRPINVTEQILTTPKREGFVVVEWGGTKI